MQAIVTKFLCPTNHRGARIKAECERGSVVVSADTGGDFDSRHAAAAQKLVEKFAAEDLSEYGTPRSENPWIKLPRVMGWIRTGEAAHIFDIPSARTTSPAGSEGRPL